MKNFFPLLAVTCLWTPTVFAKQPKGSGLTNGEIIETVQKYNNDAKDCYLALLDKDKTAEGKVKIRMLIDLKGKVSASRIEENSFKDKTLGNCLMERMKAWQFPKPRGGEIVSAAYPFEFKTAPAPAPSAPAPQTPAASETPPATPAAETNPPPATPATPEPAKP
jgi:TonB family protein